jgi:putative intracellular protease/amidase
MTLSIIANVPGIITTKVPTSKAIAWPVVATHGVSDVPPLDLLFVPGGIDTGKDAWIEAFIAARYNTTDIIASVCTGAQRLARAGVLEGKRATTNKVLFNSVSKDGENVTWVPTARYVRDGKVWTSSGVAAGE